MSVTLHTSLGDLKIEVFCEAVPKTAENFLALCASGSYDDCLFHRSVCNLILHAVIHKRFSRLLMPYIIRAHSPVFDIASNIKNFMIQTGDPTNTGKGGQSIWGKPFPDEIRSTLKFNARGVVAMANSGPDTNKSQFFVTYSKQGHLEGKYTIFGKVIDGHDTLDAMEKVPVNEKSRPLKEIKLINVTIHANPIAQATLNS
ncbi:Peptidyl-prolyl cis-trans isomerase cyp10 [Tulasnella sp. 418]|nr:Peptidyl-prolyl cis-trans isomerase cyp10 [Tulasnella sp. 418]